jgi:uncharacterized membrane protein
MEQYILMLAMGFAAFLGAIGQIAMKKASSGGLTIGELLTNWWLYAFFGLYAVGVIINFFAYRWGGKAGLLYPVIATSYLWVAIFAAIFLDEPLTAGKIVGCILIILGVASIALW